MSKRQPQLTPIIILPARAATDEELAAAIRRMVLAGVAGDAATAQRDAEAGA